MLTKCVVLCFVVFASVALSDPLPGVRVFVSNQGVNNVANALFALAKAKAATQTLPIPDQSTSEAGVQVTLSNIRVSAMDLGNFALNTNSPDTFAFTVDDVSLIVNLDWAADWHHIIHISAGGSCNTQVTGAGGVMQLDASELDGKPQVSGQTLAVDSGSWDIHFSGSHLDFLLNILKSVLIRVLKSPVQEHMMAQLNQAIGEANSKWLNSFPTTREVMKPVAIDYSLLSPFVVGPEGSHLDIKGAFFDMPSNYPPFQNTVQLPIYADPNHQVQIFFSAYVLDTLGWSIVNSGLLNKTVTPDMVPPEVPFKLNTTALQDQFPELYKAYPDRGITLRTYGVGTPNFVTYASGLNMSLSVAIDFQVMAPNVDAFTLEVDVDAAVSLSVNASNFIVGSSPSFSMNGQLLASSIGNFSLDGFNGLLSFVQAIAQQQLDAKLALGIPLPAAEGFKLVSPQVVYNKGYVAVLAGFSFNPALLDKSDIATNAITIN